MQSTPSALISHRREELLAPARMAAAAAATARPISLRPRKRTPMLPRLAKTRTRRQGWGRPSLKKVVAIDNKIVGECRMSEWWVLWASILD